MADMLHTIAARCIAGRYVLEEIHASLMAYHRSALTAAGLWETVSASRPVDGYISHWCVPLPTSCNALASLVDGSVSL